LIEAFVPFIDDVSGRNQKSFSANGQPIREISAADRHPVQKGFVRVFLARREKSLKGAGTVGLLCTPLLRTLKESKSKHKKEGDIRGEKHTKAQSITIFESRDLGQRITQDLHEGGLGHTMTLGTGGRLDTADELRIKKETETKYHTLCVTRCLSTDH